MEHPNSCRLAWASATGGWGAFFDVAALLQQVYRDRILSLRCPWSWFSFVVEWLVQARDGVVAKKEMVAVGADGGEDVEAVGGCWCEEVGWVRPGGLGS